MLTFNDIHKASMGNESHIIFECIDAGGFINHSSTRSEENIKLLKSPIVLYEINRGDNCVLVNDGTVRLLADELKYFRINCITFDKLIDTAVKGARDGVVKITLLTKHKLCITPMDGSSDDFVIERHRKDLFSPAIEVINSLYTETFVIESKEDIERVDTTRSARITLLNGNSGTVKIVVKKRLLDGLFEDPHLYMASIHTPIFFFTLKGATVTQKRIVK